MKYKCIIFDCDGVLVDSETITCKVIVEMAKSVGLHIDLGFAIKEFSGKSLHGIFEFIEERIEGTLPDNFEPVYREKTYTAFKNEIQPIKGVHALLDRLTVPFCVASSGPVKKIKLNLTTTKLIDKFNDNIISSFEIGSWKPEPGIFLHAAEKMGFKPRECVVIEDSVYGVTAAKAGGFDVFAYVNDPNENAFENTDVEVFYDMNELDKLLDRQS
jgi:HAD superfamily hydrolase (TIGR01509 family)